MIGNTIAHYTILEKLGEGGMGVVYKAADTKLDRLVALKFLPAHASVNEETRSRFTQEAKAAAALNHPNICTIHGVEEADGQIFIVMEYIDGTTLREKVPFPSLDDVLPVAVQIGEALQTAHEHGVVHRDVKADNIMLTAKGQVKVMDFGLAKMKGSLKLTRTSSTVGTLAYMAPEQIQGGSVDQRSDIFSFGVLLFEMFTGKFPFRGEHEASLLYSIVNEEPESILTHRPDASPGLAQIFEKALEKDPAMRYQSVNDMVVDLRRLKKQSSRVSRVMPAVSTTAQPVSSPVPARSRTNVVWIGVASVVVVAAVWFFLKGRGNDEAPFASMKITRLTADGRSIDVAVSPDGRYVAYVRAENDRFSLWIRQISTTNNIAITQPTEDDIGGLTFSPDGDFLYYLMLKKGTNRVDLYQISILGGASKRVMQRVNGRISFSPDGKQFAFLTDSAEVVGYVSVANTDGSGRKDLLARRTPGHFDEVAWSPDGKRLALIEGRSGSYLNHRLLLYTIDNGKETVPDGQQWLTLRSINWVEHSNGLVVTAADDQSSFDSPQLWYYPVDGGAAKKLTNNLNGYAFSSMDRRSTQLAAREPDSYSNLAVLTGNGPPKMLTEGSKRNDGAKGLCWASPAQIVYSSASGGYDNLWLMNMADGSRAQITNGAFVDRDPVAIPGQESIVFSSNRSGAFNIWRCDLAGGNVKQLTRGNYDIFPRVTADGRYILYGSFGDQASSLRVMTVNGDSDAVMTTKHVQSMDLSPDGRTAAVIYFNEEQKPTLATIDIATRRVTGETVFMKPFAGWSPDGTMYTYMESRNGINNLWGVPIRGGAAKQLTAFTSGRIFAFAWSPDGKRLVVSRGEQNSDIILITDTQKNQP